MGIVGPYGGNMISDGPGDERENDVNTERSSESGG